MFPALVIWAQCLVSCGYWCPDRWAGAKGAGNTLRATQPTRLRCAITTIFRIRNISITDSRKMFAEKSIKILSFTPRPRPASGWFASCATQRRHWVAGWRISPAVCIWPCAGTAFLRRKSTNGSADRCSRLHKNRSPRDGSISQGVNFRGRRQLQQIRRRPTNISRAN